MINETIHVRSNYIKYLPPSSAHVKYQRMNSGLNDRNCLTE